MQPSTHCSGTGPTTIALWTSQIPLDLAGEKGSTRVWRVSDAEPELTAISPAYNSSVKSVSQTLRHPRLTPVCRPIRSQVCQPPLTQARAANSSLPAVQQSSSPTSHQSSLQTLHAFSMPPSPRRGCSVTPSRALPSSSRRYSSRPRRSSTSCPGVMHHPPLPPSASVCPSPWAPSCVLQSCSAPG